MILLADSGSPDQTAHPRYLIWAYAVRISPESTCSHDEALILRWPSMRKLSGNKVVVFSFPPIYCQ